MPLNESQKKFIRTTGKRFTNTYLAEIFGVSETTVLRYRKKMLGIKETNHRRKSDGYDNLIDFANRKGYKNVTEAIDAYGNRQELMKAYKKQLV